MMSKAEVEKRKPEKASASFWGGEKEIWENGKRTGKFEHVEGWYPEMFKKTLTRAAYNAITIDSSKIDEDFQRLHAIETNIAMHEAAGEIAANANQGATLSISDGVEEAQLIPEDQAKAEPVKQNEVLPSEPEKPKSVSERNTLFDSEKAQPGF